MKEYLAGAGIGAMSIWTTGAMADVDQYAHGHMFGEGWGFMFMGPLMMIIFVVAVVVIAGLAWRWITGGSPSRSAEDDRALAVLRERFARGEIDEAEYEARRRALNAD